MMIVSAATLLVIGLVLLLYGYGGKERWPAVAWGLGNVAQAVGMLLTLTPGFMSRQVLLIFANLLLVASAALFWAGTAKFMGARRPAGLFLMPVLVVLIVWPVLVYVFPSELLRIIIVSILVAVVCGDSGWILIKGRQKATRMMGLVLVGVALSTVLRAVGGIAAILFGDPFDHIVRTHALAPAFMTVFTFWSVAMLVALAHRSERELSATVDQLRTASLTDQLTQLGNRRFMQEQLEDGVARLERYGEVYSVLFVDADGFKNINDTYGHDCGDYVLLTIAQTLRRMVRSQDVIARWGGEEFFVLVPDTDKSAAREVAERLRQSLADLEMRYGAAAFGITVTIGGATARKGQTLADVIRRADRAMYYGKRRGKNRVEWG